MSFIYVDESGDLGFNFDKAGTSKYFVVTFLFCPNHRSIEKIINKTYDALSVNEKKRHSGIFHCYKEKPVVRQRVLRLLAERDASVLAVILNKQKVYTKLQDEKHVLYNYVTNILLDRICTRKLIPIDQPITLIASRRETNRYLNSNFTSYLETQIRDSHKIDLTVTIKNHSENKGLQVADFVS
jgi:hypothetical protein